jgi:hypothetical protein
MLEVFQANMTCDAVTASCGIILHILRGSFIELMQGKAPDNGLTGAYIRTFKLRVIDGGCLCKRSLKQHLEDGWLGHFHGCETISSAQFCGSAVGQQEANRSGVALMRRVVKGRPSERWLTVDEVWACTHHAFHLWESAILSSVKKGMLFRHWRYLVGQPGEHCISAIRTKCGWWWAARFA